MHELTINGQICDFNSNFEFRLQKNVQNPDTFLSRGGSFSSTIQLPKTKKNARIFAAIDDFNTQNQFNRPVPFDFRLKYSGVEVMKGVLELNSVTKQNYNCTMFGNDSVWMTLIDGKLLNELGYTENNEATWFAPFEGYTSINSTNESADTDVVFPTIVYNNTPITDYLDFTTEDVFGTFDGSGNQLLTGKDFPNEFQLKHAYFGKREGLTFEDFPPAVFYNKIIKRIFSEIGYGVKGEIFEQEWFNKLIMPYIGEGYKWNYKTLAELYLKVLNRTVSSLSPTSFDTLDDYKLAPVIGLSFANIAFTDDYAQRIDKIYNFKKFGVAEKRAEYICPADGRYRIRVSSTIVKSLQGSDLTPLDTIGDGVNYAWDDNILMIIRKNQQGEYILTEDLHKWTANGVNGDVSFHTLPSDIVAYCSPKRHVIFGASDARTQGSPLTNFTETVVSTNNSHTIVTNTTTDKVSESTSDITIEVDLLKNERLRFVWAAPCNFSAGGGVTYVDSAVIETNDVDSEVEINYLCGYEQLDVAGNLPQIDQKQFVSNFMRTFNLNFKVDDNSKIISFDFAQKEINNRNFNLNITDRVVEDSYEMRPIVQYKRIQVGYNNDTNDRLLTRANNTCTALSSREVIEYANKLITPRTNQNSNEILDLRNGFSATVFTNGVFELTDTDNFTPNLVNYANPSDATDIIVAGFTYNPPDSLSIPIQLPAIQSVESFEASKLQDLTYNYNYAPRLFYYLGTTRTFLGLNEYFQIKVGSPETQIVLSGNQDCWIRPTLCAFDTENDNPYPSLRYDTYLFNTFFANTIQYDAKTFVLTLEVFLTNTDWNRLKNTNIVRYKEQLYKLMSISDYDVTQMQPCTIELQKITA